MLQITFCNGTILSFTTLSCNYLTHILKNALYSNKSKTYKRGHYFLSRPILGLKGKLKKKLSFIDKNNDFWKLVYWLVIFCEIAYQIISYLDFTFHCFEIIMINNLWCIIMDNKTLFSWNLNYKKRREIKAKKKLYIHTSFLHFNSNVHFNCTM